MFDYTCWKMVRNLVVVCKTIYAVLHITDSEVVSTMSFVNKLIQVMKKNLNRVGARDGIKKNH